MVFDTSLIIPRSLTQERVLKLEGQCADKKAELDALLAKSPEDLWLSDLDMLEQGWDQYERAMEDFENNISSGKGKKKMPVIAPKAKALTKPSAVMVKKEDDDFGMDAARGTKRKLGTANTSKLTLMSDSEESDDFEPDDDGTPSHFSFYSTSNYK